MKYAATTRDADASSPPGLARVIGVPGAVLMGLGSILGTGIFVSAELGGVGYGEGVTMAGQVYIQINPFCLVGLRTNGQTDLRSAAGIE